MRECRYYGEQLGLREGVADVEVGSRIVEDDQLCEEDKRSRAIICRLCGNIITSEAQKRSVHGAHQHTLFNPQGLVFEFGCFSQAKGCVRHGQFSAEFSWFNGYSWCYASCSSCGEHLGWFYQASEGDKSFYGLILKKILVQR